MPIFFGITAFSVKKTTVTPGQQELGSVTVWVTAFEESIFLAQIWRRAIQWYMKIGQALPWLDASLLILGKASQSRQTSQKQLSVVAGLYVQLVK